MSDSPSIDPLNFTSIPDAPAEWLGPLATNLSNLQGGIAAVKAARDDVLNDPTRTEASALLALDDLYNRHVLPALVLSKVSVDDLDVVPIALSVERQSFFQVGEKQGDIVVASEVRQALLRMSKEERRAALASAVAKGDRSIVAAVASAPAFLVGMGEEELEGFRADYVKRHKPEFASKLEAARLIKVRAIQARGGLHKVRSGLFSPAEEAKIKAATERSAKAQKHLN